MPLCGAFTKSWEIVGADLSRPLPIYRLWVPYRDLANAPLRAYPNNWYAWLPKAFQGIIRIGT
jgi:hypothetical protein